MSVRARVRLEVDLDALTANFATIAKAVAPLQVMAVLKANAYGLGVRPVAEALATAGVARFGLAEPREAMALRDLGPPVHILGSVLEEEIPLIVREGIVPPVTDLRSAQLLSAEATRQGREVEVQILIDSGMGRLGILEQDARHLIPQICALPRLRCSGLFSHFPHAYGAAEFSQRQVQAIAQLVGDLAAQGIHFEHLHIANSDGLNNVPAAIISPFTMVRTGLNLYGVFDLEGRHTLPLNPVLSLKARLVQVREMPAGSTIGYGRLCALERPTRVGTVAIGYADGLPLAMTNRGQLTVRGVACPVIGRVSMDYTTIDLTAVPDAAPGDSVTCLGNGQDVGAWARMKGTVPYEIICAIGNRVERRYIQR
jgi:alanine racemase